MSAGSCQEHSCGVAVLINDCQGHPRVASEEWGAAGRFRGSGRDTGHCPGHGVCWDTSWGMSLAAPPGSTWAWEVPSFAIPSGWNEESGREMELTVPQSRPWSSGSFYGPDPVRFFHLVLVFLQFPSPGRVLWHQAAACSSSSSPEMLGNH